MNQIRSINTISKNLFSLIEKHKINYAVLRNYETLPNDLGGSDLDLWIRKIDVHKFISILEQVSEMTNAHLVSKLENKYSPKVCYLNETSGIQIDIFIGDISCMSKAMIPEKIIMNNIREYNGINVLDKSLADLIALLKEVINNGRCEEKYILPIYQNIIHYDETSLKKMLPKFSNRFIGVLGDAIRMRDISNKVQSLNREGKRSLHVSLCSLNKITNLKRIKKRPGYVISVLGTDGSGKSTIIDAITPWLEEAFHHGVIYRHLRPTVIPDLGVLLGKRKSESGRVVTNPHEHKPSGLVGSLVKWGYYLVDYTLGFLKLVWPQVSFKSKLFIFDRYYYDYYIDQRRMGISLPRWMIRFGGLIVPKPDLVVCLGGDPQKIYERKPETSLTEVTRQVEALKLFCSNRKNTVWVDTTTNIEDTIATTKRAILDMMSKRYHHLVK